MFFFSIRMARKEREGLKKASSRKWFYDITDWVQFEEVEDIEDRARSYFELQVCVITAS